MFLLSADGVSLRTERREILTSGAQNIYLCQFDFGPQWEGLDKTAVFQARDVKISVVLDETGRCQIPYEVLVKPFVKVFAGVYGTKNGELIMPTVLLDLGRVEKGVSLGEAAGEPSPDVYAQILANSNEALETARALKEEADAGRFDGATPVIGENGNWFIDGVDTGKPSKGKDGFGAGDVGESGATFTPNVDADGNLSWSNDKGLSNPATVNIKGPKGDQGEKGDTGPQGPQGEKGDTGSPATLVTKSVTYQVSDSGTIIPSGSWGSSIPVVPQGKYLWTKTELQFNTGDPIVSYSVARMGIDGSGSVSSVNNASPDETGNVTLTAADVGALPSAGGDMEGAINMNGQPISGLNDPTEATQAARKGYVDTAVRKAAPRNLLDNSDFRNPVNQRGKTSYADNGYTIDRFKQTDSTLTVSDGYINFATNTDLAYKRLSQVLGHPLEANRPYTIAMYARVNDVGSYGVYFRPATAAGAGISGLDGLRIRNTTTDFTWYVYSFTPTDNTIQMCEILAVKNEGSTVDVDIKYMCCYAGVYTAETLPEYRPKGYGAELAECQQRFHVYATESARPSEALDCCPPMILAPNQTVITRGTITVDGKTLYYNSTDL